MPALAGGLALEVIHYWTIFDRIFDESNHIDSIDIEPGGLFEHFQRDKIGREEKHKAMRSLFIGA